METRDDDLYEMNMYNMSDEVQTCPAYDIISYDHEVQTCPAYDTVQWIHL